LHAALEQSSQYKDPLFMFELVLDQQSTNGIVIIAWTICSMNWYLPVNVKPSYHVLITISLRVNWCQWQEKPLHILLGKEWMMQWRCCYLFHPIEFHIISFTIWWSLVTFYNTLKWVFVFYEVKKFKLTCTFHLSLNHMY